MPHCVADAVIITVTDRCWSECRYDTPVLQGRRDAQRLKQINFIGFNEYTKLNFIYK